MIITRTPLRVSFFGGGTDYPQWYRENGGEVLATTINKYIHISCRYLPPFFEYKHRLVWSQIENVKELSEIKHPAAREILKIMNPQNGVEIHYDGDLPARSGLGSSSAFSVGLLNAMTALIGQYMPKNKLAWQAIDLEQNILKENVGCQDQICAAYGGFNRIEFYANDSWIDYPVIAPPERIRELESHLMLVFTGLSRNASEIAKIQLANLDNRKSELYRMREMVKEGLTILQSSSSLTDFGNLLHESWKLKQTLSSEICPAEVSYVYKLAMNAGAIGGKLLGAGGGGFMLLFADPEKHAAIQNALQNYIHVPFKFEPHGSRIILANGE